MGSFNRDGGRSSGGGGFSRGGFGGSRSFGGPKKFGGSRDGGRPAMHKATCSECGDDCEIPFKPTGSRPVFCSICFGKQQDGGGSSRPSFGGDRRERRERPSFGGDREMHDAVCEKCGEDCQVPFRPTAGKPVYCSNCFDKGDRGGNRGGGQSTAQLDEINAKLDLIMTALGLSNSKKSKEDKKEVKKEIEIIEEPKAKKEVKAKKASKEVKEKTKTKTATKKVVAKKKK